MIRLGSLFRVEYKDGPFRASAYIVSDNIKDAKKIFLESYEWLDKPIVFTSKHLDDVYGEQDE